MSKLLPLLIIPLFFRWIAVEDSFMARNVSIGDTLQTECSTVIDPDNDPLPKPAHTTHHSFIVDSIRNDSVWLSPVRPSPKKAWTEPILTP